MKLQEELGIKLKISSISGDLANRTMKFGFDSNDMNRNYVIIAFDETSKRFIREYYCVIFVISSS